MVVAWIERLQVSDGLPSKRILFRNARHLAARSVNVSRWPAVCSTGNADPFGPQQAKFGRPVMAIGHKPDISVAMKQHRRCRPFHQPARLNQPDRRFIAVPGEKRQCANQASHKSHCTQADGVASINLSHLGSIPANEAAQF